MLKYKIFLCSYMSFFVYVIFFCWFRITWIFCNVLFCNIRKLIWLIIYLVYWYVWYSFDYYLVLTSFTSCLLTYFKIEHQYQTLMSLFSFITNINGYFKIPTSPFILSPPFIKFNKDLQPPSLFWPPVY